MQTGTKTTTIEKPSAEEYNEYYGNYISLIEEGDLLQVLEDQVRETRDLLAGFPEERGSHSYADGKWTIKEVVSHLIDGERHFSYRVHRISRGDETPIEGFEQDGYIENSYANERTFNDMLCEFAELRTANLRQFRNLKDQDWLKRGTASGFPVSVRALGYIMAGHVRHHLAVLTERYLI